MENNDKEKENKIRLIKIAIYIGIIIILIIVLRLTNTSFNSGINDKTKTSNQNTKIIENIKSINEEYYTEKVHMTLDDDAITLNYEKVSVIETGIKKYHNVETEYVKYNNTYYKLENEEFIKINDFIDFNYDKTFIELENIKKLLELNSTSKEKYNNNDLEVIKNNYSLQDAIKIYNEYNNTNIVKFTEGNIILEIHYKEEKLNHLLIDITDLYNLINETNYEEVKYKIEINENKEEDITWLIEKLK